MYKRINLDKIIHVVKTIRLKCLTCGKNYVGMTSQKTKKYCNDKCSPSYSHGKVLQVSGSRGKIKVHYQ